MSEYRMGQEVVVQYRKNGGIETYPKFVIGKITNVLENVGNKKYVVTNQGPPLSAGNVTWRAEFGYYSAQELGETAEKLNEVLAGYREPNSVHVEDEDLSTRG